MNDLYKRIEKYKFYSFTISFLKVLFLKNKQEQSNPK